MAEKKPTVLIIRDGWGVNPGGKRTAKKDGNASLLASTPYHDDLLKKYPKGSVSASGLDVGLPDGQMGNSEVGHLNLGAGRVGKTDTHCYTLECLTFSCDLVAAVLRWGGSSVCGISCCAQE